VDAMELAERIDQMVLFSGDADFRSLIEAMQRRRVRVTVVSAISSQPPVIAGEPRRQADVSTDLVELQSKIGRDPSERPGPREQRNHTPQFLQRATMVASSCHRWRLGRPPVAPLAGCLPHIASR
jgi:NYN domain